MRAGRSKFIFQLWFSLAKTPDPVFYLVPLGQSFWAVNIHETTDTLLPLSHHVSPPQALPPINRIHKYGPLTGDRPRRSLQVIVMRLKSLC
jgi:hypothetical protein